MEEILAFVLGVLSTVGILLVGYASIGVFKVKTKVRDVNQSIDSIYLDYQNQIDEIYRQIDSRFDKFENRINKK